MKRKRQTQKTTSLGHIINNIFFIANITINKMNKNDGNKCENTKDINMLKILIKYLCKLTFFS